MAGAAIAIHLAWLTNPRVELPPSVVLATVTGLAASALIAWELERHRLAIAQRDHASRQQARRQEAWSAALPVTLHRNALRGEKAGRMLFSDNVDRLIGYPSADFAGPDGIARWSQRVHPDDRELFVRSAAALLEQGGARLEYRMHHADGSYRWLRTQAVLLPDDEGMPCEVIGSTLDLTERKHAEEELARSEL